jgi:hypothetical protein
MEQTTTPGTPATDAVDEWKDRATGTASTGPSTPRYANPTMGHQQRVEAKLDRIIALLTELILRSGPTTTINMPPSTPDIAAEVIKFLNMQTRSVR